MTFHEFVLPCKGCRQELEISGMYISADGKIRFVVFCADCKKVYEAMTTGADLADAAATCDKILATFRKSRRREKRPQTFLDFEITENTMIN
jgi:hypothetical protein